MTTRRRTPRFTAREVILLAAVDLCAVHGWEPFPLTALIVRAWELSPEQFGLPGFEDHYPSDSRVKVVLMKKLKPVPARGPRVGRPDLSRTLAGLIEYVAPNTYRLTSAGLEAAERVRREAAA